MVKQTSSTPTSKSRLTAPRGSNVVSSTVIPEGIRRSDARVNSALPVMVNGVAGRTRDISASGVFFEIDENNKDIGSSIQFSVQLDTPGGMINLICQGEVVRLEKRDGKVGIAAKIISQTMQSA